MHLILGISASENPEAAVWRFEDDSPREVYAQVRLQIDNPKQSTSDWERISFPVRIVDRLVQAIEDQGFEVRPSSKGIRIDAIGVSMPGNIDVENRVVRNIARIHYAPRDTFGVRRDAVAKMDIRKECSLDFPLFMHNDVTCMARYESAYLFEDAFDPFVYVYVDTGVNVGVVMNGSPLNGAMHPELGHYRARLDGKPEHWSLDAEDNFCGFEHDGCFESILAKAALKQRFDFDKMLKGAKGFEVEREFIGRCIAQIFEIAILTYAPRKIVIGGYVQDDLLRIALNFMDADLKGYPLYSERTRPGFITRSPNHPDHIAAAGAALLAFQNLGKSSL